MSMQSKITTRAVCLILFFYLLSVGAGSVAASVIIDKQSAPLDSGEADVADEAIAKHDPTPSVVLLERVRKNARQQAAAAAFSLGIMAIEQKDFTTAELLVQESLQLQPSNPEYLYVAASLAFNRGAFAEAEAYQLRSLELTKAELGTQDIRTALLMDDLGTIYLAQQHYEQAERTWRESLSIREKILGNTHPSLAPRLKDLAGLVMHDGRFDETEQLLKRLIHILEADTGPDRMDIATAQHILADFYVSRHRKNEADELYRRVLADWKTAPTQKRLLIAAKLYELGNEYLSQLRLEEARPQFELVLGLLENDFGADHLYVRGARTALVKLKSEQEEHSGNNRVDQVGSRELHSRFSQHREIM